MGLEAATYIHQLVSSNPVGGVDQVAEGDDHIRLLKLTIQNSFPNITGAMVASQAELNYLVGVTSNVQTQLNARLQIAANLGDVSNAATARTNLGLQIGTNIPGPTGVGASGTWNISISGTAASATTAADSNLLGGQNAAFYRNASNLDTGTVPTARFPATLPAVSGVNLTDLNASNLSSGTIPDLRFPSILPAISGTNLLNLNADNLASGSIPNARVPAGAVTQHQGSITAVNPACTISGELIGFRRVPPRSSGLASNECLPVTGGFTFNSADCVAGNCYSVFNEGGAPILISQGGGVTLQLGGTANTGNRTLSVGAMATIWCRSNSLAVVMGPGVT